MGCLCACLYEGEEGWRLCCRGFVKGLLFFLACLVALLCLPVSLLGGLVCLLIFPCHKLTSEEGCCNDVFWKEAFSALILPKSMFDDIFEVPETEQDKY
mmetsp:Transcript_4994/g.12454  ORF Transcript_4994/g.12454 Transcript_4994/m.12454 type:complete len:99 (+) Transcript_4994:137-433(+)